MNPINKLLDRGEGVLLSTGHGSKLKVLTGASAGKTFVGRIDVEPALTFDAELGSDRRMQTCIHFRMTASVPQLEHGDTLMSLDNGKTYKTIRSEDNAETLTADFWVEQQL